VRTEIRRTLLTTIEKALDAAAGQAVNMENGMEAESTRLDCNRLLYSASVHRSFVTESEAIWWHFLAVVAASPCL